MDVQRTEAPRRLKARAVTARRMQIDRAYRGWPSLRLGHLWARKLAMARGRDVSGPRVAPASWTRKLSRALGVAGNVQVKDGYH